MGQIIPGRITHSVLHNHASHMFTSCFLAPNHLELVACLSCHTTTNQHAYLPWALALHINKADKCCGDQSAARTKITMGHPAANRVHEFGQCLCTNLADLRLSPFIFLVLYGTSGHGTGYVHFYVGGWATDHRQALANACVA